MRTVDIPPMYPVLLAQSALFAPVPWRIKFLRTKHPTPYVLDYRAGPLDKRRETYPDMLSALAAAMRLQSGDSLSPNQEESNE